MKPKDLEKLTKTQLIAAVKTSWRHAAKLSKAQAGLVEQIRDLEAENGALSLRIQELLERAAGRVHDLSNAQPPTEAEVADGPTEAEVTEAVRVLTRAPTEAKLAEAVQVHVKHVFASDAAADETAECTCSDCVDAAAETEPLTEAELADALGVEISAETSSVPLFPWVRNEE